MRKVLIFIVLAIALFLCYSVVSNGLTIGEFHISNYEQVGVASKKVDTLISQLANLNGSGSVSYTHLLDHETKPYI